MAYVAFCNSHYDRIILQQCHFGMCSILQHQPQNPDPPQRTGIPHSPYFNLFAIFPEVLLFCLVSILVRTEDFLRPLVSISFLAHSSHRSIISSYAVPISLANRSRFAQDSIIAIPTSTASVRSMAGNGLRRPTESTSAFTRLQVEQPACKLVAFVGPLGSMWSHSSSLVSGLPQ